MDIKKLESYAELIVRVGANVQKGQDVVISAELDQPEFVEMLVGAMRTVGNDSGDDRRSDADNGDATGTNDADGIGGKHENNAPLLRCMA